jgi:hypothetical protein
MAITLEANYSKKLGLPGYRSHQYMITLRTELADLTQVEAESMRLGVATSGEEDWHFRSMILSVRLTTVRPLRRVHRLGHCPGANGTCTTVDAQGGTDTVA